MLARLGFKRTSSANNSNTQLEAFQADWRELEASLQGEASNGLAKKDKTAPVSLEDRLSALSRAILKDTHCRNHFLSKSLLDQLVSLTLSSSDPDAIHQTLLFCLTLLKNDAHLLANAQIYEPLLRLLRSCTDNSSLEASETEAIHQLIKVICQRLDENPALLACFFQPAAPIDLPESSSSHPTSSVSECYIFTVLLRYFHQDDQSGVLARQSLLSLIHLGLYSSTEQPIDTTLATELLPMSISTETSLPLALAEHILDSSFAEALGCSLAAAYSLLPNDPISSDPALKHFLDLIRFTDDLLTDKEEADRERRLIASSFKEEIVQAVKTYFWDNVIKPRLQENENGEETCHLLDQIVRAVKNDGGLLDILMGWLIVKKAKANGFTFPQSSKTSIAHSPTSAIGDSLESLLLRNINSQDDLARIAALQLTDTCLRKSIEAEKLLLVGEEEKHKKNDSVASDEAFVYPQPEESSAQKKPPASQALNDHLDRLKCLLRLCGQLELALQETTLDDPTYAPYLASAKSRLAQSPSFRSQLNQNHVVKSECETPTPISHTLVGLLSQFLSNSADCNLALTNILSSTSASLLCPPSYLHINTMNHNSLPGIFQQLADEVLDLRDRVEGFDRHLKERRESLNLVDALADALGGDTAFSSTSESQSVSALAVQRLHSASDPFAKHYADTAAIQVKVDGLEVSLSTLLTNVVLLSEWGKEMVAILHARTAVGIDIICAE